MYGECSDSSSDIDDVEVYDPYSERFSNVQISISDLDLLSNRERFISKYIHRFSDRDIHLPTLMMENTKNIDIWKIGILHSDSVILTLHGKSGGVIQEYRRDYRDSGLRYEIDLYNALLFIRSKYIDKIRDSYHIPGSDSITLRCQLGVQYV